VTGELKRLTAEVEQLQTEYPNLKDFSAEQLKQELLTVEANTYAELVQKGQLNRELAPFLQEMLTESE
jgi:CPA1 family monovalent cation:H+ antiporter